MKVLKIAVLAIVFLCSTIVVNAQITFYSKDGASDPADPTSWNDANDGSGTDAVAGDFDGGNIFIIQSGHSMSTVTDWTLTNSSTLIIDAFGSLTANNPVNLSGDGIFQINDGGSYIHNHTGSTGASIFNATTIDLQGDSGNGGSYFEISANCTITTLSPFEFANFAVTNSVTVNAGTAITVNNDLNIGIGSTFDLKTYVLSTTDITIFSTSGNGSLKTQVRTSNPIPADVTYVFTVYYNGNTGGTSPNIGAQTIVGASYTNLNTTSTNDRKRTFSGTVKVSGTLTVGTNNVLGSSTLEFNGTSVQNIPSLTYNNLTISNTSSGGVIASGNISVTSTLTVNSGKIFDLATYTLGGTLTTINGSGIIKTQNTSATPLPSGKTWSQTVNYNNATGGQTVIAGTYQNFTNGNTSGTNTASGNIAITNNLVLTAAGTLDLSTFLISSLGGTLTGSGSVRTANTSSTPLPINKTWNGNVTYYSSSAQTIVGGNYVNLDASGGTRTLDNTYNINISGTFTPGTGTYVVTGSTVSFNATGSQNIPSINTNYNNLTIGSTGTKTLIGDVSVNGTLNIPSASGFLSINGNTLSLNGTTSLTGSLKGSSTSKIAIGGSAGGSSTIKFNNGATDTLLHTLTLNRTGGAAGVVLGTSIAILNFLNVTNGTLYVNDKNITLRSTSIANTAQVGVVGGDINYATSGKFIVERFIPGAKRGYRDMAPVTSGYTGSSVYSTWQENGGTTANYGTHITGIMGASPGGIDATTGLDKTQSGNPSLYVSSPTAVWSSVTNTKTTKQDVFQGYRLMVRGDRNVNLYQSPQPTTMNTYTTLRTNGKIVYGTVNYSTTAITNSTGSGFTTSYTLNPNNTAGDYSFIANPYMCAIDWNGLAKSNLTGTYWVFDPTIGTTGGYVSFDGTTNSGGGSNVNRYIQPGQAFFVETAGANPTLTITENDKAPSSTLTAVFREADLNKIIVGLRKIDTEYGDIKLDASTVVFGNNYSNAYSINEDASKLQNPEENLAFVNANRTISIEKRQNPTLSDIIPIKIWNVKDGIYTITVDLSSYKSFETVYVHDNLTNEDKEVSTANLFTLSFEVKANEKATFENRFSITFRANAALPVSNLYVAASIKNNGIEVKWDVKNEQTTQYYQVEKSTDGMNFAKIATKNSNKAASSSYIIMDENKLPINYYRINALDINGKSTFSSIVKVNVNEIQADVSIYPNPVKGKSFSIQLSNVSIGKYNAVIYNTLGQIVYQQPFEVINKGFITEQINLSNNKLSTGNYQLMIICNDGTKFVKPLIIL